MSTIRRSSAAVAAGCLLVLATANVAAAQPSDARTVFGVTSNGNRLVSFPANNPGAAATVTASGAITGLGAGERVVGIDVRPADGRLYALTIGQITGTGQAATGTGRLYTVSTTTAVATPVLGSTTLALRGAFFDIDFNPVANALRVISSAGQNLRVTGTALNAVVADTDLAYAAGDRSAGAAPRVAGVAYTPVAGPSGEVVNGGATTLFDIDYGADSLSVQNPPNNGTLTTRGPLGVNATNLLGFDIEVDGTAYASAQVLDPSDGSVSPGSTLFSVNTTTGALTALGAIDGDLLDSIAISTPVSPVGPPPVVPEFAVTALGPVVGLGAAGAFLLVRRRRTALA